MIGFVNVNKESGVGSTYVVNKIKKKLGQKCGHMGTLDPMASGVLPVGVGKASRLFDFLLDKRKTYVANFEFGRLTDTLDGLGKTVATGGRIPSIDEITRVLGRFCGEIEQVPPNFSAKNVNGRRGYELARAGVEFTLPPKKVVVEGITCLGRTGESTFSFRIDCRGGTYIRSLARDIAASLGTFGTMTALERTASGVFNIENSVSLGEFLASDDVARYVTPADGVLSFPRIELDGIRAEKLLNGVYEKFSVDDGLYRVYAEGVFWGVGSVQNGILKMKAYCRE
ncbi:MAG: tRNA pseudouridine(55) synthase TruB [Clostridia bacterium]|nr:tRNA pseudouridine(55) synthase TruB [Clostridia bacterium]